MASAINPQSMLAVGTVFPVLSILAVGARFYIRIAHKQGLKWDDWLIIPGLLMVIGMGIALIIGVEQHVVGYPTAQSGFAFVDWSVAFIAQIQYAFWILSVLNLGAVKLSLVFFYRRVFCTGSDRTFDWITKIMATLLILWTIAFGFQLIFDCGTNVYHNWGSYVEEVANCADPETSNLAWVSTDAFFDIILFILPIPKIWNLHLSVSRRLAILLIFAIGALAVVASLIRLAIFGVIYATNGTSDFIGDDGQIIVSLAFYWTMFEGGMAVIVACLPTLQIWFRKVTVEAVTRNVLGIFSITTTSRTSQRHTDHSAAVQRDADSSHSNLDGKSQNIELYEVDEHS